MTEHKKENIVLSLPFRGTGGIIYNVTIQVEKSIVDDWLRWIVHEHAPQIVATNCFTKFTLLKLMEQDDSESSTYAIQYFSAGIKDYQRYQAGFAAIFSEEAFAKWGNKTFSFSTVMKVVV